MAHSLLPYLLHAIPPLHLLATPPFFFPESSMPGNPDKLLTIQLLIKDVSERHIFTVYTKVLPQQFILCYSGTLLPEGGQKQGSQASKALSQGKHL